MERFTRIFKESLDPTKTLLGFSKKHPSFYLNKNNKNETLDEIRLKNKRLEFLYKNKIILSLIPENISNFKDTGEYIESFSFDYKRAASDEIWKIEIYE